MIIIFVLLITVVIWLALNAAMCFARRIAEEKGEKISGKSSFADIDKNTWYSDYIGYLAKYKVIEGYNDGTFKPDAPVTRAEFVAMSVRYYSLFNAVNKSGYTVKYTDVDKKYWAYDDIAYAKNLGYDYSIVLGHSEYYPKAGYVPASVYGIKAPFDVLDKNFMAIKLNDNAKEINGIIKYDTAFGID